MDRPRTIPTEDITAVILAGGRGSRMGGVDKGLQNFQGMPLALYTLLRLQPQVGPILINANRNLAAYEAFGADVWPDTVEGFAGPLAGFYTGLERCETPWLLTVPCDTPLFPVDLVQRLVDAVCAEGAEIGMVMAPDGEAQGDAAGAGLARPQPVFCLLSHLLLESLEAFLKGGGRKIDAWTAQHRVAYARFDRPGDTPHAFYNANTLAELHALQARASA